MEKNGEAKKIFEKWFGPNGPAHEAEFQDHGGRK